MIGQTIGHYKIEEKLGEGGMGVVYKARDTKLNRTVALKFLPDRVQQDQNAKSRFIQEAQAAAGLNHPNICTVHGVEEHDGSVFMVMEYVEGGTLRSRIPFKSIDDAITIATQIGEALEEAHAKGIVHRDVKADNIMLTAKGQAKVMDFGLAKLKGALKLTRTSSTVGTLGYMAPEQIQGGEVDHRSDIFSFGVLLFEMLTGKLPFRGEHEAAMVYSIVNEEPQDIAALAPDLSPIIGNAVQRCLEKDPNDRYQHFDDIVADLRRSQKKTSRVMRSSAHIPPVSPGQPVASGTMPVADAPKPTGRKNLWTIVAGGIGVAALGALGLWFLSGPSLPQINPNMDVSTLQIPATEYQYPGISPDGKWLAFAGADLNGNWDIYMMFIETGENKRLTTDSTLNLGNAATARFSPDGSSIVYSRMRRGRNIAEICVVSVLSGLVRVIADTGIAPQWSPAGDKIVYYRSGSARFPGRTQWREYWSVPPQGGQPGIAFIDSLGRGTSNYFSLGVSPDGSKLVFTRPMEGNYNEVFTRDLVTGEETQITNDRASIDEVVWADNGYIFYTSNRSGNFNIWANPENGGDPVQVTRGAGPDNGLSISTSANRMVFSQRTQVSTLWMVNTDGTEHRQVYPDENIRFSHISPDGSRLALSIGHPTLAMTLMVRDLSTGRQEIIFPHDSAKNRILPIWSPSGGSISFIEFSGAFLDPAAKVIHLDGGRRVQDLGTGILFQWLTDSTALVARDTTDDGRPDFNAPRLVNLSTGLEENPEGHPDVAIPVLNGSKYLLGGRAGMRLLTREQLRQTPRPRGIQIVENPDWNSPSQNFLYYAINNFSSVWRFDFRTLKRSKIVDLQSGYAYIFGMADYRDKVLVYSRARLKTSIVKVDNVFVEE